MGIMRLVLCCLALLCTTAWCANKTFGAGACTSSNQATCCHPDGTKFCAAIKASDIAAVSNGVCVWTNLAGQTEDIRKQWNSPWINNFACGKDDCNVNNATSISSNVGTVYYGMVSNLSDSVLVQPDGSRIRDDFDSGAHLRDCYACHGSSCLLAITCSDVCAIPYDGTVCLAH